MPKDKKKNLKKLKADDIHSNSYCEHCSESKDTYLQNNQDSNDPTVAIKNILTDMKYIYQKLQSQMRALGISEQDLASQEMDDAKLSKNIDSHPLVKQSTDYYKQTSNFLNELYFEQQRLDMQFGFSVDTTDIDGDIKTVSYNHTLIPKKIWRLLYEIHSHKQEKNAKLKNIIAKDIIQIRKLINRCLNKSKQSLTSIANKKSEYNQQIQPLLKTLSKIKQEVKKI